jgi:ABC-type branched-subunit amino acid transport system ATPase component
MLAFVGLESAAERPAAALTFAARKRVELARALAVRPSLLLATVRRGSFRLG